ncbi:hypothetical protein J7643_04220 [bacterium]|nr:hypothetical protein [bacterium]
MHVIRIPTASSPSGNKRSYHFEDLVRAGFGPGRMIPSGIDWGDLEASWHGDHWLYRAKTPHGNRWLMLNDPIPSRGQALLAQQPLEG